MTDIDIVELKARLDKGDDLVLIDVRETWENAEFNLGGQNIPLGLLPLQLEDLEDDKDNEVVVYCRVGGRSGMAKQIMLKAGFTNVRNLLGGTEAWLATFGNNMKP